MFLLKIPHKHDVSYISDMREELLTALEKHDEIVIDVHDIDYITTPLLGIFLALDKTLREQAGDKRFMFKNVSPHFKNAIADFGCTQHLERAFQ